MRGADVLADTLEACDVEYVFGVAGSVILGSLDAIDKSDVTFVPCRDEQVAASMATAYAMATRRPTGSISHVGPGVANQLLSVAAAYRENAPLVVITGNEPSHRLGRDVRHEWDVMSILERVTKHNVRVTRERPHEQIRDALIRSVTGTPGPVHIDFPRDLEEEEVPEPDPDSLPKLRQKELQTLTVQNRPSRATVERIADMLRASERPAVIAGSEVRWFDASDELENLADLADVPVLTTSNARGAVPESHPRSVGLVGRSGLEATNDYLREADLVIGIGTRFSDLTTTNWTLIDEDAEIVHATVRERELDRQYLADVTTTADPQSLLRALSRELESQPPSFANVADRARQAYEDARETYLASAGDSSSDGVDPRVLIRAVERIADDYAYTTGGGVHSRFAARLPVEDLNGKLATDNFAGMSQGLPLAMGAQIALDRPVFTFEGDGGFAMVMGDLETLVREDIPVKVFVLNNNGMMSQAARQKRYYDEQYVGTRFSNPNFDTIAEEFGMYGDRITEDDEVEEAVTRLLDVDGPGLLEVRIDPWVGTDRYDRD